MFLQLTINRFHYNEVYGWQGDVNCNCGFLRMKHICLVGIQFKLEIMQRCLKNVKGRSLSWKSWCWQTVSSAQKCCFDPQTVLETLEKWKEIDHFLSSECMIAFCTTVASVIVLYRGQKPDYCGCRRHLTIYFLSFIGAAFSTKSLPVTCPIQPSSHRQHAALCLNAIFACVSDSSSWSLLLVFSFCYQHCWLRPSFILSALFVPLCDVRRQIRHSDSTLHEELSSTTKNDKWEWCFNADSKAGNAGSLSSGKDERDWGCIIKVFFICVTFHSRTISGTLSDFYSLMFLT